MPRTRVLVASVPVALLIAMGLAVVPATAAPSRAAAACTITTGGGIGETGDRLNVGVDAPGCGVVHGELYRRNASGGPWKRVQERDHRPGADGHILFSFTNSVCGDYLAKFSSGEASAQTPVLDRRPSDCS